jgi:hypothetical protein
MTGRQKFMQGLTAKIARRDMGTARMRIRTSRTADQEKRVKVMDWV